MHCCVVLELPCGNIKKKVEILKRKVFICKLAVAVVSALLAFFVSAKSLLESLKESKKAFEDHDIWQNINVNLYGML